MTHPIPTHDSPPATPVPPRVAGRMRARLARARRAPLARRIASWLAVGASAVALLRALLELLAAWRAL